MARIVLVHGAMHGAWCWEAVVPALAARGHDVAAIDLPGLGDDPTPFETVTADDWADRVAAAACAGPGPAVLVGHSLGGTAIAQAAERVTDRVAGLVFVSAILVPDGETMASFCPEILEIAETIGATHPDDPAAAAIATFYQRSPPDLAAAAIARLRPQPPAVADCPVLLTAARFGSLPRAYIECDEDAIVPISLQRRMQSVLPCDPVVTMTSDHSPFLCSPTILAGHIDAIARRYLSRSGS